MTDYIELIFLTNCRRNRAIAVPHVECRLGFAYVGGWNALTCAGPFMATIPTLNDQAKTVLRVLLNRSNIAGYDLVSSTGMTPSTLMEAVATLQDNELIQVVGNSSTEKDFQFSRFAVLPAAKSFAGMLIK